MIDEFKNEHSFLSNFYVSPFMFKGIEAQTTENLYQALKTERECDRINILKASTPGKAKMMGRNVSLRDNWDDIKERIMLMCLKIKFADEKLFYMLINTGDVLLVEGNWWHDNFWGNCKCDKCKNIEGKNVLGNLLMGIRG